MNNRTKKENKIKVIKKNDVRQVERPPVSKEEKSESVRREIVSTVSDWVNELRRDRTNTGAATDRFFSKVTV